MSRFLRRRSVRIAFASLMVPALIVGAYGFYLANSAGMLPWQADPTRIPITPFADIPGFSAPAAIPTRTPQPARTSTPEATTPEAESALPIVGMDAPTQEAGAEGAAGGARPDQGEPSATAAEVR